MGLESLDLFGTATLEVGKPQTPQRRSRPARPRRVRATPVVLSALLPGAGHLITGARGVGLRIFLGLGAASILGAVALFTGWMPLLWLGLRAMMLLWLFAVVDSAYRQCGVKEAGVLRASEVVLLNLLLYGEGSRRVEESPGLWAAVLAGPLAHMGLIAVHPMLGLLAEVALLVLVAAGARALLTKEEAAPLAALRLPRWSYGVLAALALLWMVQLVGMAWAAGELAAVLRVDRRQVVAVPPYYQNPAYGLRVEMGAPGWSFEVPEGRELLRAVHRTGGTSLILLLGPRLPGILGDELYTRLVLEGARRQGYTLGRERTRAVHLGPLPATAVDTDAVVAGQRRRVTVVAAGEGWREYLVWAEYDPSVASFARRELTYLLQSFELDGQGPPDAAEGP